MRHCVLVFLLFTTCCRANAQRFIKVFDNIPALLAANPNDVHTNAFVVGGSTIADGQGGIYTWNSTSTTATNADLSVLKANNFSTGRWFRFNGFTITGPGVTNYFDFTTITNLTVLNTNTYITNFFFNNTYVTNIGQSDNWIDEGTSNSTLSGIAKPWRVDVTNSVNVGQPGEAGRITMRSTNGTYTVVYTITSNGQVTITPDTPDGTAAFVLQPDGAHTTGPIIEIKDGAGNVVLNILANSGWTGTGTNFLSDDGSYKQAVSLNPSPNFLPYNSNGVTFGDSPLFTSGGALFLTNGAVSVFKINAGSDDHILMLAAPGINTDASIQGTVGGTLKYFLEPNVDNSLSAIAYKFDTVNVLTGAQAFILVAQHAGTNKFTVAPDSGYTGAGTAFLSDDGTYKAANFTNNLGGTIINPSDTFIPYRSNATTFADSLMKIGNAQTVIAYSGTNAITFTLQSQDTNAAAAYVNGYLYDSDGSAEAGLISFTKNTGWDIGDASQRDGNIGFNTLHNNASYNRLNIDGSSGDFTFFDSIGNAVTALISGTSGYTGAGTLFLSDDGTYKSAGGAAPGLRREIWISAESMTPDSNSTTTKTEYIYGNPAFWAQPIIVLPEVAADDNSATFNISLPTEWDGGDIKMKVYWTAITGTATDGVTFHVSMFSSSDGENTLNPNANATGTVYQNDTYQGADLLHISPAITLSLPSGGGTDEMQAIRVGRDSGQAGDTKTGALFLLGVKIQYTEATSEPAAW